MAYGLNPGLSNRLQRRRLDPSLRDQLVSDTVLIVGANFGMGSSR